MQLSHVTLDVADMARSRAFYVALGLRLLVDAAPRYCRFQIGDSASTLSLHHREGAIAPAAEIGIVFASAEALDAFVEGLEAKGLRAPPPVDQSWLWRETRLTDPDGHVVLLMHAGANQLDPPWRVR